MGIFSFLGGTKDEPVASSPSPAPSSMSSVPSMGKPDPEPNSTSSAPSMVKSEDTAVGALDPVQTAALQGKIVEALKTVFDPEIPVDIYELGLIYDIIVDADRRAQINMTLTSPACPSAQQIPVDVRNKVRAIPEITDANVSIVWEPPWGKERMSEAAKMTLGFM